MVGSTRSVGKDWLVVSMKTNGWNRAYFWQGHASCFHGSCWLGARVLLEEISSVTCTEVNNYSLELCIVSLLPEGN